MSRSEQPAAGPAAAAPVPETLLCGWGRTAVRGIEVRDEALQRAAAGLPLTRGLGRSYGDSSLPPPGSTRVAGSALADRVLSFDPESGRLRAEAGLGLAEMSRLMLHQGWFTPVSPGTQHVTLGGMVASDVHGKNHHVAGTIGRWVRELRIALADGQIVDCSREQHPDLFLATLGGMGLTGHILEVELQLERVPSAWIVRESFRLPDLDRLLARLEEESRRWPLTAAWMDTITRRRGEQGTLGRGILYVGRWAEGDEAPSRPARAPRPLPLPFELPSGLLNRATLRWFNRLVYASHWRAHRRDVVPALRFFYPLDRVRRWNLAYGRRGVTQHQSVLPRQSANQGIRELLEVLADAGACSLLTVVKDCGEQGDGMLSFPRPGMSLALDIPIQRDADATRQVIDRLNACVIRHQGRIYLTKDGFTRAEDFRHMEPRLERFLEAKRRWDPSGALRSAQSDRLGLTAQAAPRASGAAEPAVAPPPALAGASSP